ncbi:MAG: BACON domain-containing carbohydrate-binding protein [Bacteroidales bacterium]|nr:BACON domain-containing carbohydrate-binding protein [Bacteroidales bacterium]
MKTNRFLGFIMSVAALAFAATACDDKKEDLGAPQITLNPSEISVGKAGTTTTIELTATREWTTDLSAEDAKWISVLPTSGSASADPVKVEVKVLENTGFDRSGSVSFSIGFDSKTLVVNQAGTGKVEGVIGDISVGEENKAVEIKDVLVTGVTKQSIVITDPTGSILVFAKANPGAKVGDKVNVTGTTGKHNGLMQIATPTISVVSSGNAVTYPDPTTIDASNITSFSSSVVSFVTFKAVPKKSSDGKFVNFYVGDVTSKDLSLSYYPGDLESLLDKETEVKGWYVGGGTHYQVVATNVNGKDITSIDGGSDTPDVPGTKMTLVQMLTADRKANTVVESEEVLVGAITTKGYVATDGTSSIYVFHDSTPTVKVGDKVTFKGTLEDYYGLPEITSPRTTTVSSGNAVTYPAAKDITSTFDSYTSSVAEYVTYVAKVVKNGNYTNFEVEGATKFKGALSSAPTSIYSSFAEGDKVQITGYFNTLNTNLNLLNVIVTEVKVLEKGEGGGDNPGGEEGTIKWSGLSDWTVSQDKNTISLSFGAYTITATKNSGSTAPTVNSNMKDCRVYAKGTVTIATTGDAMTQIVFNLSSQGQKRLAPITADNGNVAAQQAGDKTVTWTGSSKSVTFTVGDKADFGSDGSSKAGQFDFSSIVIK